VRNRLLYEHHQERINRQDKKNFRLFLLAQVIHYGALFLLLLGGLVFIVIGLKALLS